MSDHRVEFLRTIRKSFPVWLVHFEAAATRALHRFLPAMSSSCLLAALKYRADGRVLFNAKSPQVVVQEARVCEARTRARSGGSYFPVPHPIGRI
jgi:hypothetical protein